MTEAPGDPQPLAVRELGPADAAEMRALFSEVFRKEMTQALWDWKYARPHSVALGVWRDGRMIAHYGGMGVDISYKGQPSTAVQICDVMVNVSARQAVRKTSPFYISTSTFIDRYIGYERKFLLGYGFPSDRHMDLAAHLNLYGGVGRMWELSWDLATPPRMPLLLRTEPVDAASFARHRATLDALAARQRGELPDRIIVRKDAAFIKWRFLDNPQERYELRLVKHRLTGKAIGLCVFKVEAERVLWMEVLAAREHLPALAQVARAVTWQLERRKLGLWCAAADVTAFGTVTQAVELPITTPTNVRRPGPAPEELKDRWWLLAGDTDWL